MSPSIPDGTLVLVKKFRFRIGRDDIVTAFADGRPVIKRAVGLPGETVEIRKDGNIYINGERYENRLQNAYFPGTAYSGIPVTLGEDEYFLLGDNRYNSVDSRMYGPVHRNRIFGKVVYAFVNDRAKKEAEEMVNAETAPGG